MTVPADVLVRVAGSALFLVVGVAALALARGRKGALALGAVVTLMGANLVLNNLSTHVPGLAAAWGPPSAFAEFAQAAAVVALALSWPEPIRSHERARFLAALAIGGLFTAVGLFDVLRVADGWAAMDNGLPQLGSTALIQVNYVGNRLFVGAIVTVALLLPMRFATSAPGEGKLRLQLALGAVLFSAMNDRSTNLLLLDEEALVSFGFGATVLPLVGLVAGAGLWVAATRRPDGRLARDAALAILAAALAGLAIAAFFPDEANAGVGALRALIAAGWAYGVLRAGFLGRDLRRATARRGTVAMTALAALFAVAQVAQEFLSAEYGLLVGGLVAGAVLFAARPLERAMAKGPGGGSPRDGTEEGRARREEAYRNAVRLAMRDRTLTREEESHLHTLAEELGIGAGRAHALLVEVEREARVPPGAALPEDASHAKQGRGEAP